MLLLVCNRFALPASPEEIAAEFDLGEVPALGPRYNVAPGEEILVVRMRSGRRVLGRSHWGLSPSWIRDPRRPLLNVRAETLRGRPGRSATAREGRCLVPAGGFYEWRRLGRTRQPYFFRLKRTPLLALAALSETAPATASTAVLQCAIVTTEPNDLVALIHERMPVIIPREAYSLWLDPAHELHELLRLLRPLPADEMTAYPVLPIVNKAGVEDPRSIEPAAANTLF